LNKSDIKNLSEKPTDDLLKILKSANNQKDLKSYISSNLDEELSLDEYLGNKLTEKGISKSQAIKNSNLDRTYGYEIFKGQKVIGREKLIALCIGIGLNLTETQRALTIGKQKILYAKDARDSIIIFSARKSLKKILLHLCRCQSSMKKISFDWMWMKLPFY